MRNKLIKEPVPYVQYLPEEIEEMKLAEYQKGLNEARQEAGLYAVIPMEILESKTLSSTAKLLYGSITGLSRKTGKCYATNKYLSQCIGIEERSIGRPLKELSETEYIEIRLIQNKKGMYRDIFLATPTRISVGGVRSITQGGYAETRRQKINKQNINKQSIESFGKAETSLEPVKETFKTKRKIFEQRGQKYTPRKMTIRQKMAMAAFQGVINYFKQKGYDEHGMLFLEVKDESRNAAARKLAIRVLETLGSVAECQKMIDWWFKGNGEWASYEPEQCFMSKTIERYLNRGKSKQIKTLEL